MIIPLRVSVEMELKGLDKCIHNETASAKLDEAEACFDTESKWVRGGGGEGGGGGAST